MLNPPITGIQELDAYLAQLAINISDSTTTTAVATPDAGAGEPVGFSLQYLHIKYATDSIGTGFSDSEAGMTYFGVYNSSTGTESTNPTDYTWFNTIGFGGTNYLWYTPLGGRQVKFAVAPTAPSYKWLFDPGTAIDIDNIVPAATVNTDEIVLKATADTIGSSATNTYYPAATDTSTGSQITTVFTKTSLPGSTLLVTINVKFEVITFNAVVGAFTAQVAAYINGVGVNTFYPKQAIAWNNVGANQQVAFLSFPMFVTIPSSSGSDSIALQYDLSPLTSGAMGAQFGAGAYVSVSTDITVLEAKR